MGKAVSNTKKIILNKASNWDAFINYIETMYFPGAIEALDGNLIFLEFENFKSFYFEKKKKIRIAS